MSQPVIKVENLGKKYIIGHQKQEKYTAMRDVISNTVKSILTPNKVSKEASEEFWALKDINFEINQGDRVGIIGRNGAGKSTLLKVLSRITEPTKGQIKIRGRVASLLEVGTGFHPELTGRENIFLNGAILGMSRIEIKKKFDEIVAFAEVEKFLDTPVKRYSSGMYVRLAFAVAAHLEPEVLIVDEVLAVGDAQFQKKCLGKMQEVSNQGRTILFISHNMSAIASLCNQGIVLDQGELLENSSVTQALDFYHNNLNQTKFVANYQKNTPNIQQIKIDYDALNNGNLKIRIDFTSPWKLDPPLVGLVVSDLYNVPLFGTNTLLDECFIPQSLDKGSATVLFENLPLRSGTYKISVWLGEKNQNYDIKKEALTFEFVSSQVLPGNVSIKNIGYINVSSRWYLNAELFNTKISL